MCKCVQIFQLMMRRIRTAAAGAGQLKVPYDLNRCRC